MPSRRAIRGVLHNFLGSFSSRNADHEGYWVFGFVVADWADASIDLLADEVDAPAPAAERAARQLARRAFRSQLAKAHVAPVGLAAARLTVTRAAVTRCQQVHGRPREGWDLTLTVRASRSDGRADELGTTIFVAPHDPALEIRSTRASASAGSGH